MSPCLVVNSSIGLKEKLTSVRQHKSSLAIYTILSSSSGVNQSDCLATVSDIWIYIVNILKVYVSVSRIELFHIWCGGLT